MKQHRNWTMK